MTDIVQKLWGFCHTLRHDGIDYGDYALQGSWWLPGLVTLRHDDARLKVRISRWQLQ